MLEVEIDEKEQAEEKRKKFRFGIQLKDGKFLL